MKYYKNSDIALQYNVSDKTVRNWITASVQGKLGLKLYEQNNRTYIADSVANNYLLAQLAVTGKKYRNNRTHKLLRPSREFYKQYKPEQIIDIANTLDKYHEISWHYSYFGDGADYWNTYLHELLEAGTGNLMTNTIEALRLNFTYIDKLIEPYDNVNVMNICVGNNLALKDTLGHIYESGKLRRFIMGDISPTVLNVSEKNITKWFNNKIAAESHQIDIRYQRFEDVLAKDTFGKDASNTANLIFFIAGPLVNFKDAEYTLKLIRESMGKNDLLFITFKRDTDKSRGFFDFNIKSDSTLLSYRHKMLPSMLGLDESLYAAEQAYDTLKKLRYIQIRLKTALSIEFEVENFKKTVELSRGDTILLWRSQQYTDSEFMELLTRSGFSVLQFSQSLDQELFLTISRIETETT